MNQMFISTFPPYTTYTPFTWPRLFRHFYFAYSIWLNLSPRRDDCLFSLFFQYFSFIIFSSNNARFSTNKRVSSFPLFLCSVYNLFSYFIFYYWLAKWARVKPPKRVTSRRVCTVWTFNTDWADSDLKEKPVLRFFTCWIKLGIMKQRSQQWSEWDEKSFVVDRATFNECFHSSHQAADRSIENWLLGDYSRDHSCRSGDGRRTFIQFN